VFPVWRRFKGLGPQRQPLGGARKVVRQLRLPDDEERKGIHQSRHSQKHGSRQFHNCHGFNQVQLFINRITRGLFLLRKNELIK